MKCSSCKMKFNFTRFYSNIAQDGGVIILDNEAFAEIYNSHFESNEAISQGGVIGAVTESYFTVDSIDVQKNWAQFASTINVLDSSNVIKFYQS